MNVRGCAFLGPVLNAQVQGHSQAYPVAAVRDVRGMSAADALVRLVASGEDGEGAGAGALLALCRIAEGRAAAAKANAVVVLEAASAAGQRHSAVAAEALALIR